MGLISGIIKAAKSAFRYVKYGKSVGNVHADGSKLYKKTSIFLDRIDKGRIYKQSTRTLVDKDGTVKKVITKKTSGRKLMDKKDAPYSISTNQHIMQGRGLSSRNIFKWSSYHNVPSSATSHSWRGEYTQK